MGNFAAKIALSREMGEATSVNIIRIKDDNDMFKRGRPPGPAISFAKTFIALLRWEFSELRRLVEACGFGSVM